MLHAIRILSEEEYTSPSNNKSDLRGSPLARRVRHGAQITAVSDHQKSKEELGRGTRSKAGLQKGGKAKRSKRELNLSYFYDLLFTRKNLKLVHIVCHDKQEHADRKVDEAKMFTYS